MTNYVAVINLLPHAIDIRKGINQVVADTWPRFETITFSVDDAISLVESALPGSKIRIWAANHFFKHDISRLEDSGLNLEYRYLADYETPKLHLEDSLPVGGNSYGIREQSDIYVLTLHHTVGWQFDQSNEQNAINIANYHVGTKGWPGIGYHYLIGPNGQILATNELLTVSYHAGALAAPGDENRSAIGICFAGDFRNHKPKESQIQAGKYLVEELVRLLPNQLSILPHKRMPGAATICPGQDALETWLRVVAGQTQ